MSTFSGINAAFRGLTAARQGIELTGQNIANAGTEGYTRQRLVTTSIPAAATASLAYAGVHPGEGVSVDGIARLGDDILDTRVRTTSSIDGYWAARADASSTLELSLREPGKTGLSAQLDDFFSSWQDVSNRPGEAAPAKVLVEQANTLASRIAGGYRDVADQWASARTKVDSLAARVNESAGRIAQLNESIRTALVSGGTPNELIDQRSQLITEVAGLVGGSTLAREDGTVDVYVGGNALVSGPRANTVTATGSRLLEGAAASPVHLEWAARPGTAIALDGGTVAGTLSALAPAASGRTGGTIAEAAASYSALATSLAARVNALHAAGATPDGTAGHDFFALAAGVPAARGLSVIPTGVEGVASAKPASGGRDGSVADAISQLGSAVDGPTTAWTAIVAGIGVGARTDAQQSRIAELGATAAVGQQKASASVDTDEENVNLLTYQSAYQAAARVMSAVDQMLDTLINRTGIVGR